MMKTGRTKAIPHFSHFGVTSNQFEPANSLPLPDNKFQLFIHEVAAYLILNDETLQLKKGGTFSCQKQRS
jgi:hypothetical protein